MGDSAATDLIRRRRSVRGNLVSRARYKLDRVLGSWKTGPPGERTKNIFGVGEAGRSSEGETRVN